MRQVKEVLICDICGRETDALTKITLPLPFFSLGDYIPVHSRTDSITTGSFEVCRGCEDKIIKMIEPHCEKYGEYDYCGNEIKWKQK